MSIVKINASDQQRSIMLRETLQQHSTLGTPEIIAGRTAKGTYFYKEIHPRPFKYVYTALLQPDGTEIIAQDIGNKFVMTKSKNGIIVDDIYAERLRNGNEKTFVSWSNNLKGQKKQIPEKIIDIFNKYKGKQKNFPLKSLISCARRSFRHYTRAHI